MAVTVPVGSVLGFTAVDLGANRVNVYNRITDRLPTVSVIYGMPGIAT